MSPLQLNMNKISINGFNLKIMQWTLFKFFSEKRQIALKFVQHPVKMNK